MKAVRVVALSKNSKLGPCAATYSSVASTCPVECALRDNGCYAQSGNVGLHQAGLAATVGPVTAARQEALQLRAMAVTPGRPLRLHVSGDARTPLAATILAKAAGDYQGRGGGLVWTYTHAWRAVRRAYWGIVSVLASTDTLDDVRGAAKQGYAPARYVAGFPGAGWVEGGIRWIACPSQSREGVTCHECRLCMDGGDLLHRGGGIAFAAHGVERAKVLAVINLEETQ